jgi:hypothetical protein
MLAFEGKADVRQSPSERLRLAEAVEKVGYQVTRGFA